MTRAKSKPWNPVMKMILLALLATLTIFTTANAENITLSFSCEGPNLHYINQFDLQGTLTIDDEVLANLDQTGIDIKELNFKALVRRSGFNATDEVLALEDMNGTLKKFDDRNFTLKPFYSLQLVSKKEVEPRIYASLNIDYPGLLSSKLRVGELREDKAKCVLVQN